MKKNKVFKKMISVCFYIGVNVIGIPEVATHNLALYKLSNHNPIW